MTVNKFGNYLYIKTQQHRLGESPLLKKIKEPLFKSVCVFTLKGNHEEGSMYNTFENKTKSNEFKIAGEIQHIDVLTDWILISINQENPLQPQNLIGSTVNEGDVIRIFRDATHSPSKDFSIEFIVLCSLI